jgi:hypothetical protein
MMRNPADRSRQKVRFLLAGAGILAALLLALVLLGPRLVNTKAFRDFALAELEGRTGVRFSYVRAEVTLFFRPRVAVREASLEIPGIAQGKIQTLEANPELIPLLRGKFRLRDLLLEGPDMRVRIPEGRKPGKAFSVEAFEGNLSSLLGAVQESLPGTIVTVRNGRLDLSDGDGPIVSLSELNARVGLPPEQMTLSARCVSRYWKVFSIEAILHPEDLRGDARLEMEEFRVRDFIDRFAPGGVPWLGETEISLRGRIESKGLRAGKAGIAGSVPALTVRRGTRRLALKVNSFQGSAEWMESGFRATLADLVVEDPGIRLSGELSMDRESPSIEARLEGREAKIPAIRTSILALAGDLPGVRDALDVIRGGTFSRFSLAAGGRSPKDLTDIAAFHARATLRGGTIVVPGVDLTLTEAGGEASLTGGILTGRGLYARLGNSRAREGTLRMGIAGDDPPFHAEFLADANLGELKPLLRRLVPDERFRKEIDRIREVRGAVSGRLTLGERLSSIRPAVVITNVDLAGRHERVPFPIAIRGGRISYDGDGLSVTDLRGNLGRSSISGLTGQLDFGEIPSISIRGGTARIMLDELYPWIASLEGGGREAMKPVRSVRGEAGIDSLSLVGPLGDPAEWRIAAGGSVENLEVTAFGLPGPVTISRGRFHIRPEEVSLTEVEASFLDAACRGEMQLHGYRTGADRVTASLRGVVGGEAAKWAFPRLGIPHPYAPRTPFSVTGSTLSWERGGSAFVDAELAWPSGPDVSFSLRKTPEMLSIEPLVIRDAASDVSVSFHFDPETAKGRYSGTLSGSTLEKVAPIPVRPGQRIHGEMEVVLDRNDPRRSSARGTIDAVDLSVPWKRLAPLVIRRITLSAEGGKVRVASSDLLWDDVPLSLTGTAQFGGETVVANLDITTGDIDIGRMMSSIRPESPGGPEAGASAAAESRPDGTARSPGFPVTGILRFRADSVSHGSLTWRPFRSQADIGSDRVRISLTEAILCRISTLGTLTFDSSGWAVELAATAEGEDFDATMTCLSGREVSFTGEYGITARVAGKGTGDALVRSLKGPVKLTLADGRIYRMTLLSRILTYLNVNELVRGGLPDLDEEGFPYRTLDVRGEMSDGKFLLEEATMDAPSMGIVATGEVDLLSRKGDLEVLVSPFRTVDTVVRKIPILRYILGGTLVAIPVTVRGDIGDPKVRTMDPASVGKGLLGIVERTLKVPARVITPILPGDRKEKEETSP